MGMQEHAKHYVTRRRVSKLPVSVGATGKSRWHAIRVPFVVIWRIGIATNADPRLSKVLKRARIPSLAQLNRAQHGHREPSGGPPVPSLGIGGSKNGLEKNTYTSNVGQHEIGGKTSADQVWMKRINLGCAEISWSGKVANSAQYKCTSSVPDLSRTGEIDNVSSEGWSSRSL